MDDRGHLAQALLDRLPDAPRCVLDDGAETGELDVALPSALLGAMPGVVAGFCREFDLKLVQLLRREAGAWLAVFAWSDDIGRPRFLSAELHADWHRPGVLLLRERELVEARPGLRFVHALLRLLWRHGAPGEPEMRRLNALREEAPRSALDLAAKFFPRPADMRVVSQAARLGTWSQVVAQRRRLRRAARLAAGYPLRSAAASLARLARELRLPARAVIAFVGSDDARREAVHQAVVRDLAAAFPSGTATMAYRPHDEHWGIDLRIVLDPGMQAPGRGVVRLDAAQPLPALVAAAERAILHWLESRVERRFPDLLVGRNPPAARLLQWASHARLPWLASAVQTVLNCDIECELRAPVLMPHPYGIVIERGSEVGNRVTILQQATLAAGPAGAPVIEENAVIGPGARVLGAVRIGRNAIIGANAVVTTDVASHTTIPAGGLSSPPDVARRKSVVNS
jgi:serine O-acetyltransferase